MQLEAVRQCPSTGDLFFYIAGISLEELEELSVNALQRATSFSTPILLNKKPYFPSLPSVFIFSALFHKFLAYMAYIGTFLHLHNLNKAISHIFFKKIF